MRIPGIRHQEYQASSRMCEPPYSSLLTTGNVVDRIFKADRFAEARSNLTISIEAYKFAITKMGTSLTGKLLAHSDQLDQRVEDIVNAVQGVAAQMRGYVSFLCR